MSRRARHAIPDFPRDRPTVREVQALVDRYASDPANVLGGAYKPVLEGGEVSSGVVRSALEWSRLHGSDADVAMGEVLLSITTTQRRRLTLPYYRD